MNYHIKAGSRSGTVHVPSSKSCAHRMLICAALSHENSRIFCDGISKDIAATIACLKSFAADIDESDGYINIAPIPYEKRESTSERMLDCGESGSTLRFLLPVAGALGINAVFRTQGRLSQRPMDALTDELCAHGMSIKRDGDRLICSGALTAGEYSVPGNISSQYISGLLMALPLLDGDSTLRVTGSVESADYIAMTEDALQKSRISFIKNGNDYEIAGNQQYFAPQISVVEGDWSNAAFFLCMGAFSEEGISIDNMPQCSKQGDKKIINILRRFGAKVDISGERITVSRGGLVGQRIDACAIPDLVPTISALAAGARGTTEIFNAARLRYKESDRLNTVCKMLKSLGADIEEKTDGLVICGKERLLGGSVCAENDHRIAMAAAVAAAVCENDVIVEGAQCVEKSYPSFWNTLESLML